MTKLAKTPTLQIEDALTQLASGATLEEVVPPVPPPVSQETPPVSQETPPVSQETPPVSQETPPAAPPADPLMSHLKEQVVELSKANQALSIELALKINDLAVAQAAASAHTELLGGLTKATCAAINIRHIQLGHRSTDLTHLTPQAALAEFNKVHDDFLTAFAAGQHADSRQTDAGGDAQRIPSGDTVRRMTSLK